MFESYNSCGTEDTHVHFMYIEAAKVCTKCS